LSLFQQVWSPPFLSAHLVGGFGCMNIDGEWSDIRQAIFAGRFASLYVHTKRTSHLLRGIAGLHASFPLILHPINKRVAPGNFRFVGKKDYGVAFENYGHQGRDVGTVSLTTVDWGIGTAFTAAAEFRSLFGDLFLDIDRQRAFLTTAGTLKSAQFSCDSLGQFKIKIALDLMQSKIPLRVKCVANFPADGKLLGDPTQTIGLIVNESTKVVTFAQLLEGFELEIEKAKKRD